MSEERAAKLRRLDRLRRKIPHVSASALSAILAEVASHGIPERRSRRDIGIARDEMVHCDTPYGKLFMHVPVVRGGAACTMLVINPIALLWKSFREGGGLTAHMTECLVKKPSSPEEPGGLIVYADEVIPGNALSFDNKRKLWAMYFSFCEFGPVALQREASWFDILCYRSSEIATLDAGVSQAFGAVLKLFFWSVACRRFYQWNSSRSPGWTLISVVYQIGHGVTRWGGPQEHLALQGGRGNQVLHVVPQPHHCQKRISR